MVSFTQVQESNAKIASTIPSGVTAVFVGATSGIGEYTVKGFAKRTKRPHIYIVGRSQESANRIISEMKELNSEGDYEFMKTDTSLMRNVDEVCNRIKERETSINLLCLEPRDTEENLNYAMALAYHGRMRFTMNLLPLLQRAYGLRRVLSIFAGGKDGPINFDDIHLWKARNPEKARGHMAAMMTLTMEALAKQAPTVSFVHGFPGPVRSNIAREKTVIDTVMRGLFFVIGPLVYMPEEETGERYAFLATSGRYPPHEVRDGEEGGMVRAGLEVAKGSNGKEGSGVYIVDQQDESSGAKPEAVLAKMRDEGAVDKLWKHTTGEFDRIIAMRKA